MRVVGFAVFSLAYVSCAMATDDCSSPFLLAGRDTTDTDINQQLIDYTFDKTCSGQNTKSGFDFEAATSSYVDLLPVKSMLKFGSRKEHAETFCREQEEYHKSDLRVSQKSSVVVREAFNAYALCMSLSKTDVFMDFDLQRRMFTVKMARRGHDVNFMGITISPTGAAKCGTTVVQGGKAKFVNVGRDTVLPLSSGDEVAITCEKAIGKDGVIPGFDAYIRTSAKNVPLHLEPDVEYTPQYASQMREALIAQDAKYTAQLTELRSTMDAIGSTQTGTTKPVRMTGGKGWDELQRCPAGQYVSGVGAIGGGGGKFCYNCVTEVKFICEPFRPASAAN